MKVLYVSDLDGTLLRSDARTSEYTNQVINQLTSKGMLFSYATARSYLTAINKCNRATLEFLLTRKGDIRDTPIEFDNELGSGDVFYFVCIDRYEKLEPQYIRFREKYHCIFQKEIYSGEQWLEIIPKTVSKANAILRLKKFLGAEYIVAFGDGKNDIEMFEIADESYAVENAVDELKAIATGIIESNDSDGVAKWLYNKFCMTG